MKDEIKEILEALKPQDEEFTKAGIKEYPLYLSRKQQDLLLDYITNLQEENERLKENNKKKKSRCTERNHRIRTKERILERRNKKISKLEQQLDKYKNVINKIKEYVKENNNQEPWKSVQGDYILELLEEVDE